MTCAQGNGVTIIDKNVIECKPCIEKLKSHLIESFNFFRNKRCVWPKESSLDYMQSEQDIQDDMDREEYPKKTID